MIRTYSLLLLALCAWLLVPDTGAQYTSAQESPIPRLHKLDPLISLTDAEMEYLTGREYLTMVCDPLWPPYDYIDEQGRHAGMAADFVAVISERLDTPIRLIPTRSWPEAYELAKQGKCDLVSMLNRTPERDKDLDFTEPYTISQLVLIGPKGENLENGLADMTGKTMAVVKGYRVEEELKRDYPGIAILPADTTAETLKQVADDKAHATVVTLVEAAHFIRKYNYTNLTAIGKTDMVNLHRLGVRKNDPLLLSIMRKAVDSLSDEEKHTIMLKWVANLDNAHTYSDHNGWPLAGAVAVLVLVVVLLYRKMR